LPQADATIDMLDFSYAASELQAGKQLIQANNKGTEDHEAVIFRIRDGKTIEDVRALLAKSEEQQEQQFEELLTAAGNIATAAGQTAYVEQEFTRGRYALICFLPSPAHDRKPHFELGMVQEVIVQ
jgi:hypothetical protein